MALKYVSENSVSLDAAEADESLRFGDFVAHAGSGDNHPKIRQFDPSSDDFPIGIVVRYETGPAITENMYTFSDYDDLFAYESGDYPVYFAPLSALSQIAPETPSDTSVAEPDISAGETVGIVDLGDGPCIVEDGYTNGGTTYSEQGGGDFVPLGRVTHDSRFRDLVSANQYGQQYPVRIDYELIN
jgi:hypothetical protein